VFWQKLPGFKDFADDTYLWSSSTSFSFHYVLSNLIAKDKRFSDITVTSFLYST